MKVISIVFLCVSLISFVLSVRHATYGLKIRSKSKKNSEFAQKYLDRMCVSATMFFFSVFCVIAFAVIQHFC